VIHNPNKNKGLCEIINFKYALWIGKTLIILERWKFRKQNLWKFNFWLFSHRHMLKF